jgi:hypothetical protein
VAIAVRSTSSLNAGFGAQSPAAVPVPAGVQAGDLLVAVCMQAKEGTSAPTWPSGWSQIGTTAGGTRGGANGASAVFVKTATASEGTTYSVTYPATTNTLIFDLTGANTATPTDAAPVWNTGTTSPCLTTAITVGSGSLLITVFSVLNGTAMTFGTPTNMTVDTLVRSGNYLSSGYFHKLGMTAGSTGAVSSTPSTVGTTPWQTVALSVAAAATAPTTDQLIVNSAAVTRAAFI